MIATASRPLRFPAVQRQAAVNSRSYEWLLMVFLTMVFLAVAQDFDYARRGIDSYNVDADEIIADVSGGSLIHQVGLLSLGTVSVVLLLRRGGAIAWHMQGPAAILPLGLALWILMSPLWAEDTSLTSTRAFIFFILCIGAVAFAQRFRIREIARWTMSACTIYVVLGLLAELAFGTFKPWQTGYRFAGALHPNGQGLQCGLLLICSLATGWNARRWKTAIFASIPFTLGLLFLTGSRTSLVCALLVAMVYIGLVTRPITRLYLVLGSVFCLSTLLVFAGSGTLINASRMGRVEDTGSDQSFNGRSFIWADLAGYIRERPITGYGYGGFWTPTHIGDMSDREGWGVAASHSAYVDCALAVGLVGLALYIGVLASSLVIALKRFLKTRNPDYAFSVAVLLYFILDGLLDSVNLGVSLLMFLCMLIIAHVNYLPADLRMESNANELQRFGKDLHAGGNRMLSATGSLNG